MSKGLPGLSHVDHVGLTVPDLDPAVRFYCDVFGGHELYRLGPFDAAEMPRMSDGAAIGPRRTSTSPAHGLPSPCSASGPT